jgi:hypothetical protein
MLVSLLIQVIIINVTTGAERHISPVILLHQLSDAASSNVAISQF